MLNKIVLNGKSISLTDRENSVLTIENSGIYQLEKIEKKLKIVIKPSLNVHIILCEEEINHYLTIEISKNSFLNLSYYSINSSANLVINLQEMAKLDLLFHIISRKRCEITIHVNHLEKNSFSKVSLHGLNESNELLLFDLETKVLKNISDCRVIQNAKIMNVADLAESLIKPKLLIDFNSVEANHSAYIGSFKEETLFFLATLGINRKDAILLLKKAFFLGDVENNSYVEKFCLEHLNE